MSREMKEGRLNTGEYNSLKNCSSWSVICC